MSMTIVGQRTLRKVLEQKARTLPDKTFLIFEDPQEQSLTTPGLHNQMEIGGADLARHSYTYRQFDRIVNRTANGLLDLGVTKGDRVNLHPHQLSGVSLLLVRHCQDRRRDGADQPAFTARRADLPGPSTRRARYP